MYVVFVGGTNDGAGLVIEDHMRDLTMPVISKRPEVNGGFYKPLETEHYHVVRIAGESENHFLALCGVTVDQAIKKLMVRYTEAASPMTESKSNEPS
jgi:hypothetical protein